MKSLFVLVLLLVLSGSLHAQRGYDSYMDSDDFDLEYELDRMDDRAINLPSMESQHQLDRMLEQQMRQMETTRTLQIYDEVYRDSPRLKH